MATGKRLGPWWLRNGAREGRQNRLRTQKLELRLHFYWKHAQGWQPGSEENIHVTKVSAAGRLLRLTGRAHQAAGHLGLVRAKLLAPKSLPPLLVPLTIPITAWGRGHKPLTRMCRGLGKPRYWVTHDPKVLEDGWNGALSWQGTIGFLSHYPFLNRATKSPSYLANPKLGKKEIITEREAKGSKYKQVHPWISGYLWGFNNWHSV